MKRFKKLLPFLIYLADGVVCYVTFKKTYIHNNPSFPYTVGDRNTGLIVSSFSWVGVAAIWVAGQILSNEPAKW